MKLPLAAEEYWPADWHDDSFKPSDYRRNLVKACALLIAATSPVTRVRIRNVNTGTFIEADVQTPNGVVEYEGSASADFCSIANAINFDDQINLILLNACRIIAFRRRKN